MPSAARRELQELFSPLRQTPEAVASVVFALVLVLVYLTVGSKEFYLARTTNSYFGIPIDFEAAVYQFSCAFCLFLVLPVCLKKFSSTQKLSDYGLGLGNWRLGFSVFVPVGLLVVAMPGAIGACSMNVFWVEYPLAKSVLNSLGYFIVYEILYGLLYYTAYESFFRGLLQFQLRESLGPTSAILVQTSITTLLHIGKPEAEIASALIAGLLFGSVAFHLRSVWPLVIVHWALGISTDICCAIASGRW